MGRKNLNDAIHGDRQIVRAAQGRPSAVPLFTQDTTYVSHGQAYHGHSDGKWDAKAVKYAPCYHKHPVVLLAGAEGKLYGGSCIHPVLDKADIFIGFDSGMQHTAQAFPWHDGHEISFPVSDMCAPKNAEEYIRLVDWTFEALKSGSTVHCGCIGGHGRTGMFIAALMAKSGVEDAITRTREIYCPKAVESSTQVDFLVKHFGVKKVGGAKADINKAEAAAWKGPSGKIKKNMPSVIHPLPSEPSIWR